MAKKEEISIEEEIRNSLNEKLDDNEIVEEDALVEVEETAEEESVEESEVKKAEETPIVEDNDPAPVSLSGAIKAKWRELPADVRAEWKKREDDIHRQMTAQDGDLAVGRKIKEIAAPYEQIIREEGGTVDGAFKDMMHTSYVLRKGSPQQKAEAVMHAIKQFNIDMSPYFNQGQQQDPNAQFQALQRDIEYLRQQADPQAIKTQLQEEMQRDTITTEIQAFAANPENVHFEAVKPIMGSLIASGRAKNLQEAYEMAIYADPSIRSELEVKAKQAETEKKKAEMAAKKKASLSVSGSHGASPNANAPQKTIEEDIREQMRSSLGKI
jgi:hypothetical protein